MTALVVAYLAWQPLDIAAYALIAAAPLAATRTNNRLDRGPVRTTPDTPRVPSTSTGPLVGLGSPVTRVRSSMTARTPHRRIPRDGPPSTTGPNQPDGVDDD